MVLTATSDRATATSGFESGKTPINPTLKTSEERMCILSVPYP